MVKRKPNTVYIAGLDPAFRNFGIAVAKLDLLSGEFEIEELKLIRTEADKVKTVRKSSDDMRRASEILDGVLVTLGRYDCPFVMAEVPVGSQSASAMKAVGISYGILAAVDREYPVTQVTASEAKFAATGVKTATKEEMIEWAVKNYPKANWLKRGNTYTKNNEHLADAVAVIKAGLQTNELKAARAALIKLGG